MRRSTLCVVAALAVAAVPVLAQDTAQKRGVRIGLTYQPGTKPGVVVLPVAGQGGDSVQAILQRDLDFSDRVTVIGGVGTSAEAAVRQAAGAPVNYGLWKTLGAAAIVQASVTAKGVHIALHDVAASRVLQTREFALPSDRTADPGRFALHGVSDEIEKWITGTRGIAQTRILYVRGGRIYVIDSDGAGERAITTTGTALSPTWHPRGHSIAYSQFWERGTQIVVRDLGAEGRPLPATTRGLNITPEFAPDGGSIVYAHGEENGTDLVIAPTTGSAPPRRITVGRGTDNVSPSFSPDGKRLAFTSGRAGHPEIYVVDVDGSNPELLTAYNFGDQSYRSNPAWSPSGREIAFQAQLDGRFQIMTLALRDRGLKQLTHDAVNEDPAWAPDGRHVVFTSNRTGTKQLFVMDTESGRTRQLTRSGGVRLAAWSRYFEPVP